MKTQQCRATSKRTGQRCKRMVLGAPVCQKHGQTARVKAERARLISEGSKVELAQRWGVPVETTPVDAILGQIYVWAGIEQFYRAQVAALRDDEMVWGMTRDKTGGDDRGITYEAGPNVWLSLHEQASKNLVRFAAEAVKAGVDIARVRLAEQQGAQVADTIKRIGDGILRALVEAGLGERFVAVFEAALAVEAPRHLRLLTALP